MRDRYWHIQMFLPEGKGGTVIDSSQMLKEENPVIGTGDWDDIQCQYFKGERNGLAIGDVVLVREGNRPVALCEIIGDCFHDDGLTEKYINYWFRNVEILDWADPNERNSLFSQGTLRILYKHSDTPSWHYINDWYKRITKETEMKEIIDLLQYKKQIVIQGAPGTGKTYIAKDIAEQMIFGDLSYDKVSQAERLKTSEQFKLVQFHPSYTYEDFVRGIEVKTESGQPVYVTCNRVLGEIAKKAYDNWLDSKKDSPTLAREKTFELQLEEFKKKVEEKIATESAFRIEGTTAIVTEITDSSFRFTYEHDRSVNYTLLFTDLIKLDNSGIVFKQVKDVDEFDLIMKRKASYYFRIFKEIKSIDVEPKEPDIKVSLKNFVLIIDEINRANLPVVLGELIYALEYRGENVESMYGVEEDKGLIVPPNLYIIGTMNTADRSVGQIDYAIRRRFAFVDTLPKPLTNISGFDIELFKRVSAFFIKNVDDYIDNPDNTSLEKSEFLSDEFLPEDVWIGHSYFIMDDHNHDIRLNYEIKPLLREYLKDGILKESVEGEKTKVLINSL